MSDVWIPAIEQNPMNDKFLLDGKIYIWNDAIDYLRYQCNFSADLATDYLLSLEVKK